MNNDQKLIHHVEDYNYLKVEVKSYDLQQKMLDKMAWFCGYIFALLFSFTVYGYWFFKSKQHEIKHKANLASKVKINLEQKMIWLENELNQTGASLSAKFAKKEESINRIVMKVRQNPSKYTEDENKVLFFWEEHEAKHRLKKGKPFEELLYMKSMLNLIEKIEH